MSRRTITVLVVFVLAPLVLATLAAVGFLAYAVDDLFFACDRHRPEVQRRVDRLVEDVPELRLTHVEPSGCDSGDDPAIAGRPTTDLPDLDRALVGHGCRGGPADFTDTAWRCPDERIVIAYFGPTGTDDAAEVDVRGY